MSDIDLLLRLYEEDQTQARFFEGMRARTTSWVIIITGAILAILTRDGPRVLHLSLADLPLTFFLLFIGLLGTVVSQQFHEHIHFHHQRARNYRNALEQTLTAPGVINPEAK